MSKNVLVTGGAGFVAHHVIENLLRNTDWNIISLDRLDFSGNLNRLADMMDQFDAATKKRVRVVHHDLRAELNSMLQYDLGDVNLVLHLAAGSHVDRSIADPMSFVLDNVVGTCNILNYARTLPNLERFIYFSTDRSLVLHLQALTTASATVTTQLTHILLPKQVVKNLQLHTKIHTKCQFTLRTQ